MDRNVHAYIGWAVCFAMAAVLAWVTHLSYQINYQTQPQLSLPAAVATSVTSPLSDEDDGRDGDEDELPLFSLINTGDVMLGRGVEFLQKKHGDNYPFEKIHDFLTTADMVMVNLEGPIPQKHIPTKSGSTRFSFKDSVGDLLVDNNIGIVTLANNHTYDFGKEGFDNTRSVLEKSGILSSGHPKKVDADYVVKFHNGDVDISFVSFNAFDPAFPRDAAIKLVQTLKESGDAGYILVNIHWGTEYSDYSNSDQQTLAHDLIDAGADTIIGHHPHVTQEKEIYKGKAIYYSLGNFIFDQYFSPRTQHGLLVKTSWYKDRVEQEEFEIQSVKSQPELKE